jgi:hypothetical protein
MSRKKSGKNRKPGVSRPVGGGKSTVERHPQQVGADENKSHSLSQKAGDNEPKPDQGMWRRYALAVLIVACVLFFFYFTKTSLAKIKIFEVPTSNLLAAIEVAVMTAVFSTVIIHHTHEFSAFFGKIFGLPQKHEAAEKKLKELVVVTLLLMGCGLTSMIMILCSELLLGSDVARVSPTEIPGKPSSQAQIFPMPLLAESEK